MGKRHKAILKRMGKACVFGVNTCGASRHAAMIAEHLFDPKCELTQAIEAAGFEADHMGESIASVVTSLWEARRFLKWESLPATKKHPYNGHWVPDMEAIAKFNAAQDSDQ